MRKSNGVAWGDVIGLTTSAVVYAMKRFEFLRRQRDLRERYTDVLGVEFPELLPRELTLLGVTRSARRRVRDGGRRLRRHMRGERLTPADDSEFVLNFIRKRL